MDNPKDYRYSNLLIEGVLWFFNNWIKTFSYLFFRSFSFFMSVDTWRAGMATLWKAWKRDEKKAFCASGRIWTLNPQSRNLVFYPVELRMHYYKIQHKYSCTSMNRSTSWSILIGPFSDRYPSLFQYSFKEGLSDLLTI